MIFEEVDITLAFFKMPNTDGGGDFLNLFSISMELCVTSPSVSFWVQGCQLLLVEKELTFDDACSRYIKAVNLQTLSYLILTAAPCARGAMIISVLVKVHLTAATDEPQISKTQYITYSFLVMQQNPV